MTSQVSALRHAGLLFLVAVVLATLESSGALAASSPSTKRHTPIADHPAAALSASSLGALAGAASGPIADPLAANGFASPACTTASLYAQISPAARTDCEVSGVAVASVPLSNYAFDTNIDAGLGASFDEDVDSIVQDLLITPVWTAIVWLVHVAVVALEWCYSIDLLAPGMLGEVTTALAHAEHIFTQPWLGLALSVAGIVFAWHGLVRRRVTETLGQALLMAAMIGVGLWIIADPAGTVGTVSGLADQAALGTLAVSTTGNPTEPVGSLEDSLGSVFDSAIIGPWCYLEFGNVDWCRDPSQLDPRLAATGRALEKLYSAGATCQGSAPGLVQCAPSGSAEQRAYAGTALALSAARTNGALFLALPANGLARNDLASQTALPTLYGTLCGGSDPAGCSAGTAPQAEFRTAAGTWPRVGGLLLITIGVAGMLAMLGFIALRLVGAALGVIVYLLLAPLAVLAPAFGDSGRDTFRHWLTRLAGAALAKLVYSVMLGVTLLVVQLLTSLESLGWWTQWLLISVFWWLAFEHRHQMLAFVIHERAEPASRMPLAARVRYGTRGVGSAGRAGRAGAPAVAATIIGAADVWQQARGFSSEPSVSPVQRTSGTRAIRARLAAQVAHSLAAERAERLSAGAETPTLRDQIADLHVRRERLLREEATARRSGDLRRATSLSLRGRAVSEEIEQQSRAVARAGRGSRLSPVWDSRDERVRARQLNRDAVALGFQGARPRDYGALVGLVGLTIGQYERLSVSERSRTHRDVEQLLTERYTWLLDTRGSLRRQARGRVQRAGRDSDGSPPIVLGRRERQFGPRFR